MKKSAAIVFLFYFLAGSVSASQTLVREDKNGHAFCNSRNETECTVVIGDVYTDVSLIEDKNIGKLGIIPKNGYEKVITFPSKWLRSNSDGDLIEFTTQAWLQGQKYTISGMVFVNRSGEYVHQ
jgi:hypothetical protein